MRVPIPPNHPPTRRHSSTRWWLLGTLAFVVLIITFAVLVSETDNGAGLAASTRTPTLGVRKEPAVFSTIIAATRATPRVPTQLTVGSASLLYGDPPPGIIAFTVAREWEPPNGIGAEFLVDDSATKE